MRIPLIQLGVLSVLSLLVSACGAPLPTSSTGGFGIPGGGGLGGLGHYHSLDIRGTVTSAFDGSAIRGGDGRVRGSATTYDPD